MKTKRLLALTLALVLALGVWPMVALGAGDISQYFYAWNIDGSFSNLCNDTGVDDKNWAQVIADGTNSDYTGFKGVLIDANGASSPTAVVLADAMDITSTGAWKSSKSAAGGTLIINNNTILQLNATAQVKVDALYMIGNGSIELTASGSKLTVGTEVFEGIMTIKRVGGTYTPGSSLISGATFTVGSTVDTISGVGSGGAKLTNYVQSSGSSLSATNNNVTIASSPGSFENKLAGTVALTGTSNLVVGTSSILTINTSNLSFGSGFVDSAAGTTLNIGQGVTLTLPAQNNVLAGTLNVAGNLTVPQSATNKIAATATTVKSTGTLTLTNASGTEFDTGPLTVDQGGTLNMNESTTMADGQALTIHGTATVASGKTLTIGTGNLVVGSAAGATPASTPGKLYVKGTLAIGANTVTVGPKGLLDFDTAGKLTAASGAAINIDGGQMRMANPAANGQLTAAAKLTIDSTSGANLGGTLATNNEAGFVNTVISQRITVVPFTTPMPSYADTLISNTPVMAPVSTTYPGYGVFVISSTGFFKDFDPDKSLYANGVKMEVGVDYDVVNKGGYAQFNIYESFMQTLNGPVVFKATFISGKVSSATVSVQGVAIPDDITATAPKTGDSGSMLGVAIVMMALAMAVVVKKVRA